ncbi:MAG TPA: PAS domain S-box protein [Anaerolineales bacterium]|nr:PAS domain S-box protein [Anaerolineales bacterium]
MTFIYRVPLSTTLIDAGITVALIFPVLYFFSVRPLILQIDKRHQAEKLVQAERQQLNNILETLPGYLVLLTPDYHVPFANRFFRERFGEAHGQRCYEYLFGRAQPCEICESYKVLETRQPGRWEWTGPDKHIYDVHDFPFTDTDGSTLILEMGLDVTEQKQALRDLLEANELRSRFFDSIDIHIAYLDRDFNFIRVNHAYAKAGGHSPEFFVGKNHFCLYPNPENEAIFRQVVETETAFSVYEKAFEYAEHPERGVTYWDWSLQPVKNHEGVVEGVVLSLFDVTEKKRAEEAVRQLSRIVEQTEDTVVVTNREGAIEYVNTAFERLTGYTKHEILGKTPRVIKSDRHDREFYQKLWNTILAGETFQSEMANRKKNNEIYYEVKTITPLRDAQGNITHFVATGKDITEHKLDEEKLHKTYDELELRVQERTEELRIANSELEEEIRVRRQVEDALRQSEERLSRAQEIAHLGSWELDLAHDRLTWSDEVYRIFGVQPREFDATYESFLTTIHPEDRPAVDAAFSSSIREGKDSYEIEHRIVRHSDGEVRIVHEKCEHFRDENGKVIRSIGMVHDITERKHAEDQLRYQAALLSSVNDAIIASNAQYRITAWNSAAESLYGWKAEEVLDRNGVDIIRTEWPGQDPGEMRRTIARTGHWRGEAVQARRDGTRFPVEISSIVLRDNKGQITDYISVNRDITERKQAEQALQKAHDELELRVQERTQELVREITERKEVEQQLRIRTTAMEAAANGILITTPQGEIQWANPALTQISGYETRELIGQGMHIFNSGVHEEEYYHRMWSTILSGQVWRGEITNRRKDGSLYTEEQTITPVRDENGKIQHFIAVKQDITERKQAEAELAEQNIKLQALSVAEREQRQLSESLAEAALVLNRSMKLDEVLPLILQQVRAVIPCQLAMVLMLDGESVYDASHEGDPRWSKALAQVPNRFPLESFPPLAGMCRSHQPVLIHDTQKELHWTIVDGLEWSRSLLSVPLLAENQVIGFLNLFAEQPDFFTTEMCDRLVVFASHAAVAIQNAWLFEQVRASNERLQLLSRRLVEIQENERLYIARELHDEAGQMLTSLMLDLVTLETQAHEPEIILKKVPEMEEALSAISENLHNVAMALRPASLDHLGLVPALRQHVESVGERYKLKASFTAVHFQERLPANMETELYRIVQEALTNVARHAHATQVDVILTVRDHKLVVMVEDDGKGFDPEKVPHTEHLGLFGMRERAEMIGGKLVIESTPGKGTIIMVEVDYDSPIADRG